MEKKYSDEWKRAEEFLDAVKRNLKEGDIKTAANREYFALERAVVCCLMIKFGKDLKNHQKIWELSKSLDTGVFDLLRELYDLRLQADYGKSSEIVVLNEMVVKDFLDKIEALLKKLKGKYKL
ncbi:HEPN domain-containing protein [Candidatus Woesearchaeota archaeon]|nr:HEPN domain-containing protein [Candidatus Woesearchaeota archaeon]